MKVVYVLGRLNVGGVELRSLELLSVFRRRGHDINFIVYAISGQEGALDDHYRDLGATVLYGQPGVAGLFHFWRTLREIAPDIVHSNVSTASGYYALAARLAGVKTIITHYRSVNVERRNVFKRITSVLGRMLANLLSTRVIGVCSAVESYSRAPRRKWAVAYDGIITKERVRTPGDRLRIAYLGRLSPEKNPKRAVSILGAVLKREDVRDATLMIGGEGPLDLVGAVEAEIMAAGLAGQASMLGNVDDPLTLLCTSDVLILTSLREGLPGVVLEALSVGTPVVASDLPGVCEISQFVEGVTPLSLSEPDWIWAEAVVRAAQADNERIKQSFAQSPFRIDRHADQIAELWGISGQRRQI